MKTSIILKKFLFISFLGLSVAAIEAANFKEVGFKPMITLSRTKIDKLSPVFQEGFTTLTQVQVTGLPDEFREGDVIETDSISLAQGELLEFNIITPRSYQGIPRDRHYSFSISRITYNPDILLERVVSKGAGYGLCSSMAQPTTIECVYQCEYTNDSDKFASEWKGRKYHPVITTATLRIPINQPPSLSSSSRP